MYQLERFNVCIDSMNIWKKKFISKIVEPHGNSTIDIRCISDSDGQNLFYAQTLWFSCYSIWKEKRKQLFMQCGDKFNGKKLVILKKMEKRKDNTGAWTDIWQSTSAQRDKMMERKKRVDFTLNVYTTDMHTMSIHDRRYHIHGIYPPFFL